MRNDVWLVGERAQLVATTFVTKLLRLEGLVDAPALVVPEEEVVVNADPHPFNLGHQSHMSGHTRG